MKYKYSIAYPDTETVKFIDDPKSKEEIVTVIQEFDWNKELRKEVEFYSPSIDLINLEDKKRIIFSGIGNSKLEEFQIMFIEPIINYSNKVFDEKNYHNTNSYSKAFNIDDADKILGHFLNKDYNKIIQNFNLDSYSSNSSHTNTKTEFEPENPETINIYLKLFLAFCAPFLTLITILAGVKIYEFEQEIGLETGIVLGVGILFFIATIKIWSGLLGNKSNT